MNRRGFLKAAAGAVAGAFVVPELIVPERKVWALDGTMMRPDGRVGWTVQEWDEMMCQEFIREYKRLAKEFDHVVMYGTPPNVAFAIPEIGTVARGAHDYPISPRRR